MKLRLAGAEAHAKLAAALAPHYRTTHEQENFFFDGTAQELSSHRVVLRVRFYNKDRKAVVTLKVGGGAVGTCFCSPSDPCALGRRRGSASPEVKALLQRQRWIDTWRRAERNSSCPSRASAAGEAGTGGRHRARERGGG